MPNNYTYRFSERKPEKHHHHNHEQHHPHHPAPGPLYPPHHNHHPRPLWFWMSRD